MSQTESKNNTRWGLRFTFRALSGRNYRLFFIGQGTSLVGTWMQQVAIGWLVYRLTHSPFLLGAVSFAGQIPNLFLTPFGGVLADRLDRRRVQIVTQVLSLIQAMILAVLTLTGLVSIGHVIILALFIGIVNAFDMPMRQSFVVEMVERREDLGNAIALNSFLFNGARLIGPAIAGIVIAASGEGLCFLLNAVSYLAAIVALGLMRLPRCIRDNKPTNIFEGLREGFHYAYTSVPIRSILLLVTFQSLFAMSFIVVMPVIARDVLRGGPGTMGLLVTSMGIGALTGAIYLASRRSVWGLVRLIAIAVGIFGSALILLAWSRVLWLSATFMVILGLGMIAQMASSNTVLQTLVDDERRGRVMSLYTLSFMGLAPFGSLLMGGIVARFGVTLALSASGAFCIIAAVVFASQLPALHRAILPIYISKGILPPVSPEVEPAVDMLEPGQGGGRP